MSALLHDDYRPPDGHRHHRSQGCGKGSLLRYLVTGGGGFLGSVLVPLLLSEGHQVRVLDRGLFGLEHLPLEDIELVEGTLEEALATGVDRLVDGLDAIIHLAAVSNDPSADLDPVETRNVNTVSTTRLASAARKADVRFLFASTASIYGDGDFLADEGSPLHPLSHYAKSKAEAETALGELALAEWRPTILRFGTLFGLSPRMRFDLVVNIFGMRMAQDRRLTVFGDGLQWRPYLHVADAARALLHFSLQAVDSSQPDVFNISHENHRVVDLVEVATAIDPSLTVDFVAAEPDSRTYRVSTDLAAASGFNTVHSVESGLREVSEAVASGLVAQPESPIYRNAAWLSRG